MAHNVIGHGEVTARIVAAADRLGEAGQLIEEFDVSDVIQIDDGIEGGGMGKLTERCIVGAEHDIAAEHTGGFGKHQFGRGGTVGTAAQAAQQLYDGQIGQRFDSKVFFKTFIPGKSSLQVTDRAGDAGLIVNMEWDGWRG